MVGRTSLESLLRRDRWLVGGALAVTVALCWAWIVPMARDMYGPMTGPAAWMMTDRWDFAHLSLLFAMWVVMMAGMMLPSAAPTLLLYAGVIRKSPESERAPAHVYAFAGGYLVVWTAFSLVATALQRELANLLLLTPMMEAGGRAVGGALLIVAGLYQLTPLKRTCLESCRSPAAFIARVLATRRRGRVSFGSDPWGLLSRLLLGAHAFALRRRGDEPLVDWRAHGFRPAGKARPARCAGRTPLRCADDGAGGVEPGALKGSLRVGS